MKQLVLIASIFLFSLVSRAQLWQGVPLQFNHFVTFMYYDSIGEVSYVAGTFQYVDGVPCNVVQITDSGYHRLPLCPLANVVDMIRYDGKIFACSSMGLAIWDGTVWDHVLGAGYSFGQFMPYQGKLLISGRTPNSNTSESSLLLWDNGNITENLFNIESLWGSQSGNIRRMVEYKGKLYIAGNFSNLVTDPSIHEIAAWDGSSWHSVGELITGGLSSVWDMLVWKDTLYVCGQFDEETGSGANAIAQWDGQQWHRMGEGLSQSAYPAAADMMIFNDELYVAGQFNIVNGRLVGDISGSGFAKWTGTQWCTMGTQARGAIGGLGRFKDDLYVTGAFYEINSMNYEFIARWIGGDYTDSCSAPESSVGTRSTKPEISALTVYPNPATNRISFRSSVDGPVNIEVWAIDGKSLFSKHASFPLEIDLSAKPSGVYFYKVIQKNKVHTGKFSLRK
jgi:hypothetical protein